MLREQSRERFLVLFGLIEQDQELKKRDEMSLWTILKTAIHLLQIYYFQFVIFF